LAACCFINQRTKEFFIMERKQGQSGRPRMAGDQRRGFRVSIYLTEAERNHLLDKKSKLRHGDLISIASYIRELLKEGNHL
jgi:hypothetical protein